MIGSGGDGFGGEDLGFLLREQKGRDRERELRIFRNGSAPPTVEGSLTAMGGTSGRQVASGISDFPAVKNGNGFSTGQELLSDPACVSYHHYHVNLNSRLPPPVLSKEDWRSTQRLQLGISVMGRDRGFKENQLRGGRGALSTLFRHINDGDCDTWMRSMTAHGCFVGSILFLSEINKFANYIAQKVL
ncbi:unnamed protein product, partial [Musa hybrid cultivar]